MFDNIESTEVLISRKNTIMRYMLFITVFTSEMRKPKTFDFII